MSELGAFCAPYLIISSASDVTVGIVLCVMNIIGAVAANFLPDTTGTFFFLLILRPTRHLLSFLCNDLNHSKNIVRFVIIVLYRADKTH